ncbi:hypothetical protein D915_000993 [Fasciola hepatica]|uniref:Transmembrane protein n=1 Tax=Fasciola hepatica TaxID=6192 RepID=A0A4E0RJ66_FASHE|nr:hypothetical protein D915_000993 [Fasciola hepatica]
MPSGSRVDDPQRNNVTYDCSHSGEDSGTTSSPRADTESKSDNGILPAVADPQKSDLNMTGATTHPVLLGRTHKVRLNSVAEESSHTPPSYYHSSSLSTISSVTDSSADTSQEPFASASPEAHLSKLKSIHRKVRRRKRIRRIRRVAHFIITKMLGPLLLMSSLVLLLCGYFLSVHYLLVSGCIILLAAVGFQVQLCFTERTGPNKFNPMSVPFSIPAEDLTQIEAEPMKDGSPVPQQLVEPNTLSDAAHPRASDASRTGVSFSDLQVKRLSLALARVANNALQMPRYPEVDPGGGVLCLARRLTMASSAISIGAHNSVMNGSSWLTGNHIRHGVRRSLAWNATGASRFYERSYD